MIPGRAAPARPSPPYCLLLVTALGLFLTSPSRAQGIAFATASFFSSNLDYSEGTQEGVFTASMKTSLPIQARSAKVRAAKAESRLVQYRPGYVAAIDAGNPEGAKRATGLDGRRVKTSALFDRGL